MDKPRVLAAIRAGSVDPFYTALYHKSAPSAPPQPNYAQAAQAQGAANVDTAKIQGKINNPNVITPYGSQTVTWGQPTNYADPTLLGSAGDVNRVGYGTNIYSIPQSLGNIDLSQYQSGAVANLPGVTSEQTSGDSPTITQSLNPQAQALFNTEQQIYGQLGNIAQGGLGNVQQQMSQPFDWSVVPGMQTSAQGSQFAGPINGGNIQSQIGNTGNVQGTLNYGNASAMPTASFTGANDPVTQAIIARNQPFMDQQRSQLDTQLRNQGLVAGDEAYDNAFKNFNNQQNDFLLGAIQSGAQEEQALFNQQLAARQQGVGEATTQGNFANAAQQQAYNQALGAGQFANQAQNQQFTQGQQNAALQNQAAQQQFYQNLQNAQLGNQARQQSIQEQQFARSLPLNELNALLSTSQVNTPQFQPFQGSNVAAPQLFNAAQAQAQGAQNLYNAQTGQANAFNSGLFGLGSAGIGAYGLMNAAPAASLAPTFAGLPGWMASGFLA